MSSPWHWGHSAQSQSWDEDQRRGGGNWQQDSHESPAAKKDKENQKADRFKSVTSLGQVGKHPLPLEDRKALLIAVMHELSPQERSVQDRGRKLHRDDYPRHALLAESCDPPNTHPDFAGQR